MTTEARAQLVPFAATVGLCASYWRGETVCALSAHRADRLFAAGHECSKERGHDGRHRCACGVDR